MAFEIKPSQKGNFLFFFNLVTEISFSFQLETNPMLQILYRDDRLYMVFY